MLVVQEIRVNWSKKSRAGKAATERNAVAEAFVFSVSKSSFGYHQALLFTEEKGFDRPEILLEEFKERVGYGGYRFFECKYFSYNETQKDF